jgi:hypothetical protein
MALDNRAVSQDHDGHPGVVGQVHELEMGELRAPRAGGRDNRGSPGRGSEGGGGQPQPVVGRQLDLAELVANHERVGPVELGLAHERLDVVAIAEVRRHAAGRGVGVGQQTERFEVGHGAPNGGRADLQAIAADEGLGADRDGGQGVVLDHGPEHGTLPLGQVDRRMGRRGRLWGAFRHLCSIG